MRRTAAALLFLLVLAPVVTLGFAHWRTVRYDSLIRKQCRRYNLDFHLVKALVHEESRFDAEARGKKGELGLMQIKPAVGAEFWERQGKRSFYDPEMLLNPEHNIEVGCWYLRESLDMYRHLPDPTPYGLARYNAGHTRVARWISATSAHPQSKFIDNVDFPRTREYIVRVIGRAHRRSQNYLW